MALILWADKYLRKVLRWLKLSNSGDTLKLLVPNHIWKYIGGWTNYSCKVISQKMIEREMGYRGSKSAVYKDTVVKEQRVDGSWLLKKIAAPYRSLRCTLMGFERNYPVKIRANQLLSRTYSTLSNRQALNPWFITGFSDAESSFIISVYNTTSSKLNWRVSAYFSIHVHIKDLPLIKLIQETLGVGVVRKNNANTVLFRVSDIQELQIIIDHFKKYPLISAKQSDFLLFEQCFNLIKQKEHLTQAGFEKILALKSNLNKGLTNELKEAFPNVVPITRPEYKFSGIPDPFWMSGFATGDSTFSVSIEKSTSKVGKRVRLIFGTCLHIRDRDLLKGITNYLNSLYFNQDNKEISIHCNEKNNTALLQIKSNSDIENKVIPFFEKYPILGVKSSDFEDFKLVAELVKNKEHLNIEGLNKIVKISEGMNLGREWVSSD